MNTISIFHVALYARVSSDRQADEGTIASQVEALRQRIAADGYRLDEELSFLDDGYSGSTLLRPALDRLRDQVAAGAIDRLYVHSPDRLARNYALQFVLVEELQRCGVEVLFLNRALGASPEDDLLLQVQGVIAEYERAKICERSRRGKLHAARAGLGINRTRRSADSEFNISLSRSHRPIARGHAGNLDIPLLRRRMKNALQIAQLEIARARYRFHFAPPNLLHFDVAFFAADVDAPPQTGSVDISRARVEVRT